MVDFEKLLTESLARTHEKYVEAMRDLREVVGRASAALERHSQGKLRLALREESIHATGTVCVLVLVRVDPSPPDTRRVVELHVPNSGYPLRAIPVGDEEDHDIADRAGLEAELAELFSNPQSPVLLTLAWLRRQELVPTGT